VSDQAPVEPASEGVRLQADEGPLIRESEHVSLEQVVLHLMHERAYEEALPYVAGRSVLDVGCNTGYGTVRLASVARRAVGVDVSPAALSEARQRAGADRVEYLLVDGRTLPFPDATWDVVTSFQVIEHLDDPHVYLREIERVLAPGGVALLTTPNARFRLDPGMSPWNRFHVQEFTPDELDALLGSVFPSVSIQGMVAVPELLEVEQARVQRSLRHARVQRRAAREALRDRPRRGRERVAAAVRGVLAGVHRGSASSVRSAATPVPVPPANAEPVPLGDRAVERPASGLGGFSTAHLLYRDTDLDATMDLLAVCTKSAPR
jgi:SAM-dependent methyltransferase